MILRILIWISALLSSLFADEYMSQIVPNHPFIHYSGRIDFSDAQKPKLSSAGAYFTFRFSGESCSVHLQDQNPDGKYNYISIEIDGKYCGRIRLNRQQTAYPVADNLPDGEHTVLICKATESQIGCITLTGITCREILPPPPLPERKIEFIGNSITCGMGLDLSEIPCGKKNGSISIMRILHSDL